MSSVLRQVAQETSEDIESLYERVAWPLYKKFKIETQSEGDEKKKAGYLHAYDVFKMGITDESVFEGLDVTPEILDAVKAQIRRRLTPQPIKIRADIEVTCFTYEGIEAIRSALKAAQDVGTEEIPVKVKLIAPPMYVMTTSATEKEKGIEKLQEAIETVREHITAKKGTMSVKMEPKVVSINEEKEFLQMIEKLENENRQVDGDAAED